MTFVSSCCLLEENKTDFSWLNPVMLHVTRDPISTHGWIYLFCLGDWFKLCCHSVTQAVLKQQISDFHQASSSEDKHVTFKRLLWWRYSSGWQIVRRTPGVYCSQREESVPVLS